MDGWEIWAYLPKFKELRQVCLLGVVLILEAYFGNCDQAKCEVTCSGAGYLRFFYTVRIAGAGWYTIKFTWYVTSIEFTTKHGSFA